MGCPSVPLGEIATLQAGVAFPIKLQGRRIGRYPFAKVGDISRTARSGLTTMREAANYVDDGDLVPLRAKPVPVGSILFAKIGEAIRQNYRVVAARPLLIDNNAMAVIPDPATDSKYLFHFLRSVDFYRMATSTTVPSLRKSDLERLEVPLPSLGEQRRIADILDRADALRSRRQEANSLLDLLECTVFQEMYGDLVANERGWPQVTVGEFLGGFQSGRNLVASEAEAEASKYRVLKVSAVTSGQFRSEESKALPPDYIPPPDHLVRPGDLLFSRANTRELIGATALVEKVPPNLALPDKLWRLIYSSKIETVPSWVCYLFKQPSFRSEVRRRASGTSGSMTNVAQSSVLSISVGMPPLQRQQQFSERLQVIRSTHDVGGLSTDLLLRLSEELKGTCFSGNL